MIHPPSSLANRLSLNRDSKWRVSKQVKLPLQNPPNPYWPSACRVVEQLLQVAGWKGLFTPFIQYLLTSCTLLLCSSIQTVGVHMLGSITLICSWICTVLIGPVSMLFNMFIVKLTSCIYNRSLSVLYFIQFIYILGSFIHVILSLLFSLLGSQDHSKIHQNLFIPFLYLFICSIVIIILNFL